MNSKFAITLSMIVLASAGVMSNASAQERTRAEVRQELIQAEQNGSAFVTDTSYPVINPIFAQQAARMQQTAADAGGYGGAAAGSGASGRAVAARAAGQASGAMPVCVGPVSFCTPYFGS